MNENHPVKFSRCNLFQLEMRSVVAHEGQGFIDTCRLAAKDSLDGNCNFIDFTKMPPGTEIGLHTHADNEEEFYLIISGSGLMHNENETFEVQPGDFVRNPPGGTHSLKNTGEKDLSLFVFEVSVS